MTGADNDIPSPRTGDRRVAAGAEGPGMRREYGRRPRGRPFWRYRRGVRFSTAAGMVVELHGLTSADAAAYREHLLKRSPRDRRMRFHSALWDAAVATHVDGLVWEHSLLLGAFVDGSMRGAAYLGEDSAAPACEVALSVETAYQHAAIGRMLMAAAIIAARALTCDIARLSVLHENDSMLALARAFDARMTWSTGVAEAEIPIG